MKYVTLILLVAAIAACDRNDATSATTPKSPDVVQMDPNEILFSTPTLNGALPEIENGAVATSGCIQLHEDDWRQFELVPRALKAQVDAELLDINAIWENHSVSLGESGTAFREVHVRNRILQPLAIPMSTIEFAAFVGNDTKRMSFIGYGELLRDVHVAQIENLMIYAHIEDGTVTALGFDATEQFSLPADFGDRLRDFIAKHDLMLVHWRSRTLFESNGDVLKYFGVRR